MSSSASSLIKLTLHPLIHTLLAFALAQDIESIESWPVSERCKKFAKDMGRNLP
jgi:hypothetical protein